MRSSAAEGALNPGADVAILGEMIDYTGRYAREAGLAPIETAHGSSENPGACGVADVLRRQFPGLRVEFLDAGIPGQVVTAKRAPEFPSQRQ